MTHTLKKLALIIGVWALSGSAFGQVDWLRSNGSSCLVTCNRVGLDPVISGYASWNQQPYYVCAANHGNHGFRAGFNLQAWNDRTCMFAYGGREPQATDFNCLCTIPDIIVRPGPDTRTGR